MYTNVGGIITCTFYIYLTTVSGTGPYELNIQLPSTATTTNITSMIDTSAAAKAYYYSSSYAKIKLYGIGNSSYGFCMTITYK